MSDALPIVFLARHGETAWTLSGQHTGVTDLPLTARGEAEAVRLGERLEGLTFAAVLTSPLQRAVRTCDLAGLFSSGHFLRVFAARWLGLEPGAGRYFLLGTASLSAMGYEHDRPEPVIHLWDEMPQERWETAWK
jgi:broad specificity phosphatase PhoE